LEAKSHLLGSTAFVWDINGGSWITAAQHDGEARRGCSVRGHGGRVVSDPLANPRRHRSAVDDHGAHGEPLSRLTTTAKRSSDPGIGGSLATRTRTASALGSAGRESE